MTDARIEPYYLKEDMQYNRDTRYDNPYRTYLSSSSSQPIGMDTDIIRLLTSIDNGLTELRKRVSRLEQIVNEKYPQDHFAEVSNMVTNQKRCENCIGYRKYALDERRGICNTYSRETLGEFRACPEWKSNTKIT